MNALLEVTTEQMSQICRRIPILANCDGVEPWDAERFANAQRGRGDSQRIAASFVLTVWNPEGHESWSGLPPFNIVHAASRCNAKTRFAMAEWLYDPYWP